MRWPLPLGVSLSPGEIRALRVVRTGRRLRVTARRTIPLPPGALVSTPQGLAIGDEAALQGALQEALALSPRRGEVAMALPDASCLAHVQRFPDLQARGEELRTLVLWQMADLLVFPAKEARLDCQVLREGEGAGQVIVLVAHDGLLSGLEALLTRAGGALLSASSALVCFHNAWNAATGGRGSEGLLHISRGALGLLLRQEGVPAYARSVPMAEGDGQPGTILREVEASLDFAASREGIAPPSGLLVAGDEDLAPTAAALGEALRIPTEVLGGGVGAWEAIWDGLPPVAAEVAAAGAALSSAGGA